MITNKFKGLVTGLAILMVPFISMGKTYYISPEGDNSNSGSIASPLKTISYAMELVNLGDSCILREGTYREKIEISVDGIVLCGYPGEKVLVTGCISISQGIESYTNPINNQTFSRVKVEEEVKQLFINGKRLNIARWPNKEVSMLSMRDWAVAKVDAKNTLKAVIMPAIPSQTTDYWKGGYYIGVNCEKDKLVTWFSGGGEIYASDGDRLFITNTCYGVGTRYANGNGFGYIVNCLNALDTEDEWYWGNDYLYFKCDEDLSLEDIDIEARTQMNILEVSAEDIRVNNINFTAGAVLIEGSNVTVENCTFKYTSPFVWNSGDNSEESGALCNWGDYRNGSSGICVLGNSFSMKSCYVAHSWFNGIVLWSNSCTIDNCTIEDVNWIGKRCSGINSYGEDNTVRYCTIRNTGASSIEGGNASWIKKYAIRNLWTNNRCENACNLVVDQGFFYVNQQNGALPMANSEWCYNLLMNNRGPDKGEWSTTNVGLYVDNSSSGYKVHHNVVVNAKEGFRYNDTQDGIRAGKQVYFYNNTFYKVDKKMASWIPYGTIADADVTVCNNLGIECGGYAELGYKLSNVQYANKASVENADSLNFILKEAAYIDAGSLIGGISIQYEGTAPDIGAFESGSPIWNAGSNLVITDESIDSLTTAIQIDNKRKINLLIYPNPVSSTLNIDFTPISLSKEKHIKVVNLNGQVILEKNKIYSEDYRIETAGLKAGTYLLVVKELDIVETFRFMKL